MLIKRNLNLISVQSWTYLYSSVKIFLETSGFVENKQLKLYEGGFGLYGVLTCPVYLHNVSAYFEKV